MFTLIIDDVKFYYSSAEHLEKAKESLAKSNTNDWRHTNALAFAQIVVSIKSGEVFKCRWRMEQVFDRFFEELCSDRFFHELTHKHNTEVSEDVPIQ